MTIREFTDGIWRRRELSEEEELDIRRTQDQMAALTAEHEMTDRERLDELEACVLELAAIIGGAEE